MKTQQYLLNLAERLMRVPASYGMDQGDCDRLSEIAAAIKPSSDAQLRDILAQEFSARGETGYADATFGGKSEAIIDAALAAMRRVRQAE